MVLVGYGRLALGSWNAPQPGIIPGYSPGRSHVVGVAVKIMVPFWGPWYNTAP